MKLESKDILCFTPQSKHFSLKYHGFRSKLKSTDYIIKMISIYTALHKADVFTEVLGRNIFKTKKTICWVVVYHPKEGGNIIII